MIQHQQKPQSVYLRHIGFSWRNFHKGLYCVEKNEYMSSGYALTSFQQTQYQ